MRNSSAAMEATGQTLTMPAGSSRAILSTTSNTARNGTPPTTDIPSSADRADAGARSDWHATSAAQAARQVASERGVKRRTLEVRAVSCASVGLGSSGKPRKDIGSSPECQRCDVHFGDPRQGARTNAIHRAVCQPPPASGSRGGAPSANADVGYITPRVSAWHAGRGRTLRRPAFIPSSRCPVIPLCCRNNWQGCPFQRGLRSHP